MLLKSQEVKVQSTKRAFAKLAPLKLQRMKVQSSKAKPARVFAEKSVSTKFSPECSKSLNDIGLECILGFEDHQTANERWFIMGDKSPKAAQKQKSQKASKEKDANDKKKQAATDKQVAGKKK